ncbi:MAG: AsmA family protein, partial [Planctomycetota bacterium]
NLNAIVKGVIEKVGTDVTGVSVTVGAVDIKISEGSAAIKNLSVANPAGFSAEPMLDFGELAVKLDVKGKIIKHVKVASPHILFEQKGTSSNFQTLQKNMASDEPKEEKPAEEPAPAEEGEPAIIQIDLIEITDAQVNVVSDKLPEPKNITIKLIKIENLKGTGEEIGKQLMGQLTSQIIKEVSGQALKGELDKAIDKSLGEKLGISKPEGGDAVGEAGDEGGLGEKIGDIFKKKE